MGPGAPDVGAAVEVMLLLLIHFMVSFVFGWNFFVKRRGCSNWAWYYRHLGGVCFGIFFSLVICSGVIGVMIALPAEVFWSTKYVVELFVIDMLIFTCSWLLARKLFPAVQEA